MFFCYMKVDETNNINNIHNWWMSTSLRKVQVCGPRAETGSELGALKMYTRRNIVFLFNDIPHIYCITYLHKDVCVSWLTISCHFFLNIQCYRQCMYMFYRLLGGGARKLCTIQCWSRLLLKAVALVIPTPLTPQPPPPADNCRNPIVYRPWGFCLMHHLDPFCTPGFGRDEMIMPGTFWQNFTDTIRKIEMEANWSSPTLLILFCDEAQLSSPFSPIRAEAFLNAQQLCENTTADASFLKRSDLACLWLSQKMHLHDI